MMHAIHCIVGNYLRVSGFQQANRLADSPDGRFIWPSSSLPSGSRLPHVELVEVVELYF